MSGFRRFLLPAIATAAALWLTPPVIAQEEAAKPAKSAQDCADELLRNKEAIEAAGETPQEFFHRCWWDSTPGRPTPIKTPRATWDPGRGHAPHKAVAKPTIEAKKPLETKKPESKTAADHTKAAETKVVGAKTEGIKPPEPPVKPAAIAEAPPAKKAAPASKPLEPKPTAQAKTGAAPAKDMTSAKAPAEAGGASAAKAPAIKTSTAATENSTAKAATPKGAPVVAAPDAAPASVKPASPGAVVVKSGAKKVASKPARIAAVKPHRASHDVAHARSAVPPAWRPARPVAVHRGVPSSYSYAYRPAPTRFVARGPHGRRALATEGLVLCLYATPDARGHSTCVPVP